MAVSLAIWDHSVLLATRHNGTHPALTPAMQAGTRFTCPGQMAGSQYSDLSIMSPTLNQCKTTSQWFVVYKSATIALGKATRYG